jgi:hypothetical protein
MLRSQAVPWLVVIGALILPAFHIALAQDAKEPSIQLEKGNFWKYEVKEGEKKSTVKAEVVKYQKPGSFKIKVPEMRVSMHGTWRVESDCLVWEIAKGPNWQTEWKVWKFDAKQNDSWRSTLNVVITHGSSEPPKPCIEVVSRVVAVEDVQTPAGEFKSCLKVRNVIVANPGMKRDPDSERDEYMWWAKGVGLVKAILTNRSGAVTTTWTLTSYKVGHEISDKKLKEMVKNSDVVALVSVPKEAADAKQAQVKLTAVYKGDSKVQDDKIIISLPKESKKAKGFKQGEFIVFLKKKDKGLVLSSCAAKTDSQLLDRITKLLKSADEKPESLKKLTKRAEIIVGAEVVAFEKRESFNFYVVKVIAALKGTKRGKHLDVLSLPGMKLEKKKKYILFLVKTEYVGRKMTRPVNVTKGVLDFDEVDEDFMKKLSAALKDSK